MPTEKYLFFDTETTGLGDDARLVQIGAILTEKTGEDVASMSFLVKPQGFVIPETTQMIHGISTERAINEGYPLVVVLKIFNWMVFLADIIISHNIKFDDRIISSEYSRLGMNTERDRFLSKKRFCTMENGVEFCNIPRKGGGLKKPTLSELYEISTGHVMGGTHDAFRDARATRDIVLLLRNKKVKEFDF